MKNIIWSAASHTPVRRFTPQSKVQHTTDLNQRTPGIRKYCGRSHRRLNAGIRCPGCVAGGA
ncbi:MAG: hypothetical protein WB792_16140 [Desulfobacterales bacterium]